MTTSTESDPLATVLPPVTFADYVANGQEKPSVGLEGLAQAEQRNNAAFTYDPANGKVILYYGFLGQATLPDDPAPAPGAPAANLLTTSFEALDATQQAAFNEAASVWGHYANIELRLVPGPLTGSEPGVNLLIGGFTSGSSFAFTSATPNGEAPDANYHRNLEFNLGAADFSDATLAAGGYGTYGFTTFLHEMGHAIGLNHPGLYNATDAVAPTFEAKATFQEDNRALTIMSYFAEYYGGAYFGNENPSTPLAGDVVAMREEIGPVAPLEGSLEKVVYGYAGSYQPMAISDANDKIVGLIFDQHPVELNLSPYTQGADIDLTRLAQSVGGLIDNLQIFETKVVEIITGSGDDTVRGDDQDQQVFANSGNNLLEGRGGDDDLIAGSGNDTLDGGTGHNTLEGGAGDDVYIVNQPGEVVIEHPGGGNDAISTTMALYTLGLNEQNVENLGYAGDGDFIGVGDGGANAITGNAGADTLDGMGGDDVLLGLAGADDLRGDSGNDTLIGGAGADTLHGGVDADSLVGGSGNDLVLGEQGDDQLVGDSGADTLDGGDGNDTLDGGADGDSLTGGIGDDSLQGGDGNDILDGGDGNDTLAGGEGSNLLLGGAGFDLFLVGSGADTFEGGGGIDTLDFGSLGILPGGAGILLDLSDPAHRLGFSAGVSWFSTHAPDGTLYAVPVREIEQFAGSAGDDTLIAAAITGLDPTITLYGMDGNDRLSGQSDGTTLDGGNGTDTLDMSIYAFSVQLFVDLVANTADLLTFGFSHVAHLALANIEDVAGLRGAQSANMLSGDGGENRLEGGSGADVLHGLGGNDTLVGNGGADDLLGGDGDDVVLQHGGGPLAGRALGGDGVDTLVLDDVQGGPGFAFTFSVLAGTATTHVQGLEYGGFEKVVLLLDPATTDGAVLAGGAGDDMLAGGAGNDTLTGGGGNDTLLGEGGNDRFVIHAGDGIEQVDGGDGTDTVVFALDDQAMGVSIDLGLGGFGPPGSFPVPQLISVEATDMELGGGDDSVKGSFGRDSIAGGGGNDTLEGGNGADVLDGGAGNDLLTHFAFFYPGFGNPADEYVTMHGGTGDDTLTSLTPGSFDGGTGMDRLSYNVPKLAGGGALNIDLSHPDQVVTLPFGTLITGIELFDLTLSSQSDVLTVRYGEHHLDGWLGFDVLNVLLDPGQVAPVPVSQADAFGNVTLTYANGMTVTGFEVINYIAPVQTPTNGNDLLTGSSGGVALSGLGGNDTLLGGDGDDVLNGGTGADSMVGGAGNDTYAVDNAGDVVVEQPNGGTDTVKATLAAYVLADDVENLVYAGKGTAGFTGTGNGAANHLTGGAGNDTLSGEGGNDVLNGGAGADSLVGGSGDDTYVVDNVNDQVVELPNGGVDTVKTALGSYSLSAQVENLTYTGGSGFVGEGNAEANKLTGGAGADVLSGFGGNDTLNGGAGADHMLGGTGNDTYIVDNAGDVVTELPGGGVDTVKTSLASYTLGSDVEMLVFTGLGNFSGAGNDLANALTGGAGDDTLVGGLGADTITGGLGRDHVIWNSIAEGGDSVLGFTSGEDVVEVSASGFGGGLAAGMDLAATGRFVQNPTGKTTAAAGVGQFVFASSTHKLYWDADGSGGEAGVVVATFAKLASLNAGDIHVFG